MINNQQYALIKNTLITLKKAHLDQDSITLNYCAGILESFWVYRDFNIVQEQIINNIGGL